jgi:predicted KAP-like P-loop ATPase
LDTNILQKIPPESAPIIITALLDSGDFFPESQTNPLGINTLTRIHRIIHGLICRFTKKEDRFLILQQAITKISKSIYTAIYELTEQGREHLEEVDTFLPTEYRDLTPEQLNSLQKLTTSRIQHWADVGRLIEHPRLLLILNAWLDWGTQEDCKNYINKITLTDRGLLAFLTAALDIPISQAITKYEKPSTWEQYLDNIDRFISVKQLEPHAKLLFEDAYFEKLREREQLALMIFLDLIKAQTNKIIPKTTV